MAEAEMLLDLGDGIKRAMAIKNIGTTELSRKTGIARSLISKYRSGAVYPSARNMAKMLDALNINLHELTEPLK